MAVAVGVGDASAVGEGVTVAVEVGDDPAVGEGVIAAVGVRDASDVGDGLNVTGGGAAVVPPPSGVRVELQATTMRTVARVRSSSPRFFSTASAVGFGSWR